MKRRVPARRRAWVAAGESCWCCRLGRRAAIAAEVAGRRVAWVCQVCAADEALAREFVARVTVSHAATGLVFRRAKFVHKAVFETIFADAPRDADGGAIIPPAPSRGMRTVAAKRGPG